MSDDSKTTSPEGWSREEVIRKSGIHAGKSDVYYTSPTGKKVACKKELLKLLGEQSDISMFDFCRKKKPDPSPKNEKLGHGLPKKCHKSCGQICLRLPDSLYRLQSSVLTQLTASPLNMLKQLEINCVLEKTLIKTLFKTLLKATLLTELSIEGDAWSGNFSAVTDAMGGVLSRCKKIKLNQLKETPEFWEKCMAAAGNNCEDFGIVSCNGLGIVVSNLPALLPRLIRLSLIDPDLDDFLHVRTNKLFLTFFHELVSQESKLRSLKLDKLWSLLCDVPPQIMSHALSPLISLSVCRTSLSLHQITSTVLSWEVSAPSSLAVETDWGSWNQVPSHILIPNITRISSLSLKGTNLSDSVLHKLLSALAASCAVKELDLRGNNLCSIGRDEVVAAVTRLRVAVLTHCNLSMEAVEGVLEAVAGGDGGTLEEFDVTRPLKGYQKPNQEDDLVKKAKKVAGIRRLEIHGKQCKCHGYCNWYIM